jgi:hypothetical protein
MGRTQVTTMTADEFLAWEARQELKYEFDGYDCNRAVIVASDSAC